MTLIALHPIYMFSEPTFKKMKGQILSLGLILREVFHARNTSLDRAKVVAPLLPPGELTLVVYRSGKARFSIVQGKSCKAYRLLNLAMGFLEV